MTWLGENVMSVLMNKGGYKIFQGGVVFCVYGNFHIIVIIFPTYIMGNFPINNFGTKSIINWMINPNVISHELMTYKNNLF